MINIQATTSAGRKSIRENETERICRTSDSFDLFKPIDCQKILADVLRSRMQIAMGEGIDMRDALYELGVRHGFV